MIIPIGHESQKVRRIPWVSFIIMGVCLIVHIAVNSTMKNMQKELQVDLYNLFEYFFEHPYLEFNDEIKELFKIDDQIEKTLEERSKFFGSQTQIPADDVVEEEQQELDLLSSKLLKTIDRIPLKKYGFTPAKRSIFTLFTYMFLHGGWLHLIFNMLLFYLSGPFIEDIWGKPVFLAMYIITGMLAGYMFAVHYPNFEGPLIGASGAVSAVMGAFLVKFWRTKIKFFYWFIIIFGTFRAPAWLMLPLWGVLELYNAKAMDSLDLPGGGGVAHWAHVWGFIFGVAVALGLKYSGLEEKYLAPKIDSKVSFADKKFTYYEEAMQLVNDGKKNAAFDKLLEGARLYPGNQEIIELLWHLGLELDRKEEAVNFYLRLAEGELRQKNFDLGMFHYGQIRDHFPDRSLSDQTKLVLIDYYLSQEEFDNAGQLTGELAGKVNLGSPAGFLLQLTDVAKRYEFSQIGKASGPSPVKKTIELSLQHPDIPDYKKGELKEMLDKINRQPSVPPPVSSPAPQPVPGTGQAKVNPPAPPPIPQAAPGGAAAGQKKRKSLNVTRVIPLGFKDSKMVLNIENVGRRMFALDTLQAISVIKITSQGDKPFFLIDLFVDDPAAAADYIRTIRMFTPQIPLERFFPNAPDRLDAFRKLIALLFNLSKARPYPDPDSVQLKRVIAFPTINHYNHSLTT